MKILDRTNNFSTLCDAGYVCQKLAGKIQTLFSSVNFLFIFFALGHTDKYSIFPQKDTE